MKPTEKIAIITGAGSGIGKATAIELFANGWNVVLAGRRVDRLEQAIAEAADARRSQTTDASSGTRLRAAPGASTPTTTSTPTPTPTPRAIAIPTDVTQPDSVRNLFAQTRQVFGRLDLLFNNAGIGPPAVPIEDVTLESWKNVLDTNLTGMFLCIQEAVRLMKTQAPRGGRIINNGSLSAHSPRPNSIAYTATKHAVTGLTRSTLLDGREFDIACCQIDVGNIQSEIGASHAGKGPVFNSGPKLDAKLAAQAVLHMANLPLEANMLFTTLLATKAPFIGRG